MQRLDQIKRRGVGPARAGVLLLVLALVATACGTGEDPDDAVAADPTDEQPADEQPADEQPADDDALEPQRGGTITIGTAFHVSVDPTTAVTFGCCGGTELTAIYDTIMRYDHETSSYIERTAESVEANDDFTQWTVTLKPDITFTDGTDYDAEAVKFNVERHLEQPRSQDFQLLTAFIDSITVVDPLTVQFDLTMGWNGFPVVLAGPTGMIASPTAIEEAGEEFGQGPVDSGAGPFMIESFVPNERLELVRNPDFYGGEVYLDGITSVVTATGDNPVDSFRAGTLDAGPIGSWAFVGAAEDGGFEWVNMDLIGGQLILMNSGSYVCQGGTPVSLCEGEEDGTEVEMDTATSDPRVRRAVLQAIDHDLWNERFYDGVGQMSTEVFPAPFAHAPGVEWPPFDPDEAARLVEEAKADGWDGHIRLVGSDNPEQATGQQTFATMLEAVGMEPELDLRPQSEFLSVIQVERDFDVFAGAFGFGQSEEKLFGAMFLNLRGRYGYDSEASQEALDSIRTAASPQEEAEGWQMLAEVLAEDIPFGALGNSPRRWTHVPELHGVVSNANQAVTLDKAWLEE